MDAQNSGQKHIFFSQHKTGVILALFIFFALSGITLYMVANKPPGNHPNPIPQPTTIKSNSQPGIKISPKDNKIIARVGEENIYLSDLMEEEAGYPSIKGADTRTLLLSKIATDSVILQEGAKEKLITLAQNFYNSPDKDYQERIIKVNAVKTAVENQAEKIEGTVISIWFNNNEPGPIGYEEGKKAAKTKIDELQKQVKTGKITIQQAGEAIKNDSSLSQLDPSYKTNAIINFQAVKTTRITFDSNFNKILWNLKKGEVTPVYLLTDTDRNGNKVEALYVFGQVSNKIINSNLTDYNNWITEKLKEYEIKYL